MPESFEQMGDSRKNSVMIPFVQREFPLGTIQSWYGSIDSIPGTWRLCDGSLGTPDLRDRFLNCAGDTYPVGGTGGNINHNHAFTGDGHGHSFVGGADVAAGPGFHAVGHFGNALGTTDNKSSLPPYHSLAYIMYAGRVH